MVERPSNLGELIDCIKSMHVNGDPWIPSGTKNHLDWGPAIDRNHKILSCSKINKIVDYAVDDLTITIESGLAVDELQSLLAKKGHWLPIDLPRDGVKSSIGGMVARGISGGLRHRYQSIRDHILGIGFIRADGTKAKAGGRVVKNVAGYDLMRLLCGSWGSLALITELTLRVQPLRRARTSLLVSGDLDAQEIFRVELLRTSLTPERCDWIKSNDSAWKMRLVVSSVSDPAVDNQLKQLEVLAAGQQLNTERLPCSDALTMPLDASPSTQLVRLVLPTAKMHQLLRNEAMSTLKTWCWDLAAGAGCGDGWCNAATPDHQLEALRRDVIRLGGEMTLLKRAAGSTVPAWLDRPSRPLIEAVKRQFDPKLQLSRGRLPGVNQETV